MQITLLGAGNLATQLGLALKRNGHTLDAVWSRTPEKALLLAQKMDCKVLSEIEEIGIGTELVIVAVSDSAIESVVEKLPASVPLVVHTAGSVPMSILSSQCHRYGVFYPFQTFSVDKPVDFESIPICIEASTANDLSLLRKLGRSLSHSVYEVDSDQRQQIHLSAVFVCNFVNHLYVIGEELMQSKGLSFDLLKPLILETANKVLSQSPSLSQTGPARRNDRIILEKHMHQLANHPDLQALYKEFSERIIQKNNQ